MVGVKVYHHAEDEYQRSDDELRGVQPLGSVASLGGQDEEPAADQVSVDDVEDRAHEHYRHRYPALAPHHEGVDERALDVVSTGISIRTQPSLLSIMGPQPLARR